MKLKLSELKQLIKNETKKILSEVGDKVYVSKKMQRLQPNLVINYKKVKDKFDGDDDKAKQNPGN